MASHPSRTRHRLHYATIATLAVLTAATAWCQLEDLVHPSIDHRAGWGWPFRFAIHSVATGGFDEFDPRIALVDVYFCAVVVAVPACGCERLARSSLRPRSPLALLGLALVVVLAGVGLAPALVATTLVIGASCALVLAGVPVGWGIAAMEETRARGETISELYALAAEAFGARAERVSEFIADDAARCARAHALPFVAACCVGGALLVRNLLATHWPFRVHLEDPAGSETGLNVLAWSLLTAGTFFSVQIVCRRLSGLQFRLSDVLTLVAVVCIVLAIGRAEYAFADAIFDRYREDAQPFFYQPLRDRVYLFSQQHRLTGISWPIWMPIAFGLGCSIHATGCLALRAGHSFFRARGSKRNLSSRFRGTPR